jgi:hypothetical protein
MSGSDGEMENTLLAHPELFISWVWGLPLRLSIIYVLFQKLCYKNYVINIAVT